MKTRLSLETRKGLAVAAMTLKQPVRETRAVPAVFVLRQEAAQETAQRTAFGALREVRTTMETREQAELRRERVESITRRAPEVVITRRWIHTASHFDGQEAVVVKLPWLQRLRNWMLDDGI
jgi:hypothetical protein